MSNFFTTVGNTGFEDAVRKAPKIVWRTSDTQRSRNFSYVEEIDALRQRCEKRLQTERRQYYAYPVSYGVRLADLIHKPVSYIRVVIPNRIKEALEDEEITDINNFRFEHAGRLLHIMFDIHTVWGDLSLNMAYDFG